MLRKEKKCTPLDCWAVPFLVSRCPWFRNHPWFQNHFFWFQNHSWLQNHRFWFQNHPVLVAESSLVSESFLIQAELCFESHFALESVLENLEQKAENGDIWNPNSRLGCDSIGCLQHCNLKSESCKETSTIIVHNLPMSSTVNQIPGVADLEKFGRE